MLIKVTDVGELISVIQVASAKPKFSGTLTCAPKPENKKIAIKRLLRGIQ